MMMQQVYLHMIINSVGTHKCAKNLAAFVQYYISWHLNYVAVCRLDSFLLSDVIDLYTISQIFLPAAAFMYVVYLHAHKDSSKDHITWVYQTGQKCTLNKPL